MVYQFSYALKSDFEGVHVTQRLIPDLLKLNCSYLLVWFRKCQSNGILTTFTGEICEKFIGDVSVGHHIQCSLMFASQI